MTIWRILLRRQLHHTLEARVAMVERLELELGNMKMSGESSGDGIAH